MISQTLCANHRNINEVLIQLAKEESFDLMESRKSHYLRTKLTPYTSPLERDGTIAICANMKLSKIPFLNTLVGFALSSSSILCACEIYINVFF